MAVGDNNYYAWLKLPVEKFESDPQILSDILEKKIIEWTSHKSLSTQNKANLHKDNIRRAINDPDEWKRIYLDYKAEVDDEIINKAELYVTAENTIEADKAAGIAKMLGCGADYVKKVCAARNYKVTDGKTADAAAQKVDVNFTVEDLCPKSSSKFKSYQKLIDELNSPDLMDLLAKPEILGKKIDENTPKEKVLEALEEMHKKWEKIPQSGPKGSMKSQLDKIRSGFKDALKTVQFDDYIKYLNYTKAKKELLGLGDIDELSETAFNSRIMRLFKFTEDHDKARSMLIAYCQEKKIAFPVPRPKLAMCPFPECGSSFERTEPLQRSCPVCGRSLIVICPKCKKEKNLITDKNCDGINLGAYPLLEKQLLSANECCDSLSLETAKDKLAYINSKWADFPGAGELAARLSKLEREHGANIKKISEHCEKKEYFAARELIDRINGSFPNFKDNYGGVYDTVEEAEKQFEEALKEPNKTQKIRLLIALGETVSDFSRLNTELLKYPVEPVTEMSNITDSESGIVTLRWKSANEPNSVFYIVKRKRGAPVSSAADGEEIGKTQNMSFGDTSVKEGEPYYYAVYAALGTMQSPLCAMTDPAIIIKIPELKITPGNASIDISWAPGGCETVVLSSENPISAHGDAAPVGGVTSGGVVINNLTNGRNYYIAAYKKVTVSGRDYCSKLAVFPPVTPVKPVDPPRLSKQIGEREGEYILTLEAAVEEELVFYYSESPAGIEENAMISTADMERKAKKLTCEKTPDGKFRVNMSGRKTMIIYPALSLSGSLMVGNIISLIYAKAAKIDASVSGTTLCVTINEWPDGMDRVIVCYNFDSFPGDSRECDSRNRISYTKADYDKDRLFRIPNITARKYFISLFARGGGEETLLGNKQVNLQQKIAVYYTCKKNITNSYKITLANSSSFRPRFIFAVGDGIMPLSAEKASYAVEIPENAAAPKSETINIPRVPLPRNPKINLICNDQSFTFVENKK